MTYLYENPMPGFENAASDVASGEYEKHHHIQPGEFVLDIGANCGFFTDVALKKVGSDGLVIAIEPHPQNFKMLVRSFTGVSNCIIVNGAATNDMVSEEKMLFSVPNHTGGHSLIKSEQHVVESGFCRNIDARLLLAAFHCPRLDFLKLDAEGSELDILTNMESLISEDDPHISVECHSVELYHKCKELLENLRYEFLPKREHVGLCWGIPPHQRK